MHLVTTSWALDLVCLTETWLSPEVDSKLVDIDGFNLFRTDRIDRRGGGTAIYTRVQYPAKEFVTLKLPTSAFEGTFVDLPTLNVSIFCVYIPPNLKSEILKKIRDDITNTTDDFLNIHPNRNLIFLGDFNDFNVNRLSLDLNLTDIVDKPTRGLNILDHILISEDLIHHYQPSKLLYESPIGKSDHLSLVAIPECNQRKLSDFRQHVVYDYRSSNLATLIQNAESFDWEAIKNLNLAYGDGYT